MIGHVKSVENGELECIRSKPSGVVNEAVEKLTLRHWTSTIVIQRKSYIR